MQIDGTAANFQITNRLRQKDPLSARLFNIVSEVQIRRSKISRTGKIYTNTVLARTKMELEENRDKTKYYETRK